MYRTIATAIMGCCLLCIPAPLLAGADDDVTVTLGGAPSADTTFKIRIDETGAGDFLTLFEVEGDHGDVTMARNLSVTRGLSYSCPDEWTKIGTWCMYDGFGHPGDTAVDYMSAVDACLEKQATLCPFHAYLSCKQANAGECCVGASAGLWTSDAFSSNFANYYYETAVSDSCVGETPGSNHEAVSGTNKYRCCIPYGGTPPVTP